MSDADRACERVAAEHFGVVGAHDALTAGLGPRAIRRRVETGRFVRRHPGSFLLAGVPPTWRSELAAALAWAGAGAALSHRSAGALWELEGVPGGYVELTTPRRLKSSTVIVHRKELSPTDVRPREGLILTSPARTLLDLCDVLGALRAERALDDALHRGLTPLRDLDELLHRSGGRGVRGSARLRLFVETRSPIDLTSETTLERRLARVIRDGGLPQPVPQYEVFDATGFVARVDFAYPDERLAIEADGYRYHRDRQAWASDLARRTALATAGWRVLHFTWHDVHRRPGWVVAEIRRSLVQTGRLSSA